MKKRILYSSADYEEIVNKNGYFVDNPVSALITDFISNSPYASDLTPPAPFPERAGGVTERLPLSVPGRGRGGVLRKVSQYFGSIRVYKQLSLKIDDVQAVPREKEIFTIENNRYMVRIYTISDIG